MYGETYMAKTQGRLPDEKLNLTNNYRIEFGSRSSPVEPSHETASLAYTLIVALRETLKQRTQVSHD